MLKTNVRCIKQFNLKYNNHFRHLFILFSRRHTTPYNWTQIRFKRYFIPLSILLSLMCILYSIFVATRSTNLDKEHTYQIYIIPNEMEKNNEKSTRVEPKKTIHNQITPICNNSHQQEITN